MKNFSVLLVDDESELVYTLAERLMFRKIDTVAVTQGDVALKTLELREFDIVVLDVKMPGINGIEMLKKIKQKHPNTQVILQTGRGSQEESKEGLNEGAFDYLIKPVDIDTLIEKMKQAVGQADGKPDDEQ